MRGFKISFLVRHWTQHSRFYFAVAAGVLTFIVLRLVAPRHAGVAAGDMFFIVYLFTMIRLAYRADIGTLRSRARFEDEGIALIIAITGIAIAFSFASMFSLLGKSGDSSLVHMAFAIASIPLGWTALHMLFAFHYARLYYAPTSAGGKPSDAGGLDFQDTPEPGILEFAYFSFTIGATAQTSDVDLRSTAFRRVVLFHGIASFVFNTVLLALAVNVAASLIQ